VQNGFPAVLLPGAVPANANAHNTTAYLNESPTEHIKEGGVSAQVNWTTPWLNNAKLTSITAWRDWQDRASTDSDYTSSDLLYAPTGNLQEFKQFSEELRYGGQAGPVNWQVGVFYSNETLDYVNALTFGPALNAYLTNLGANVLHNDAYIAGEGSIDTYHQHEHSESIYTQDEWKITDHLILTGGVRYTSEHKSLNTLYNNTDTSGTCAFYESIVPPAALTKATLGVPCLLNPAFKGLNTQQAFTQGAWTGTAKLSYRFNAQNMVYASYARGNLVGGFNLAEVTTAIGSTPNASLIPETNTFFPAEDVDAFEIGAKSQLFERRLLLTVAGFYQTYYNFQLNAFTGTQFIEQTIPQARSEGVEFDSYFKASRSLTLNFGATYANTYYPNSAANQAALGNGVPTSPLYQQTDLFRLPGSRLSFAPLWSVVGGVYYKHPLVGSLIWTFAADGKYQSSYNTGSDHDPVKLQTGFAIFNARLGVGTANGKLTLEVWANNIFNTFYSQARFDGVLQTFSAPQPSSNPALNNYYAFPGVPRFFGATVKAKF